MMPELAASLDARQRTLDAVRAMLIDKLRVPREPFEIDPDVPLFGTGLALDSVDAVEVVVALEETFGLALPDDASTRAALRTPSALVDLVLARGASGDEPAAASSEPLAAPASAREASEPEPRDGAFEAELSRLRASVVVAPAPHLCLLRVTGEAAFDLLDRATSAPLKLYDAQARLSLLLDDDGMVRADLLVARHDEDYLVLAESEALDEEALARALEATRAEGEEVTVERLGASMAALEVHGPYAWELLGELVSPEIVSIPYLTLHALDDELICLRSGKTGEFGYVLLGPRARIDELGARLLAEGERFDVGPCSRETLDHAALENWFFCVREEGRLGLGPLELGLSWRLSRKKDFVGSAALAARRERGPSARVVCALCDAPARPGDLVLADGQAIGRVLRARRSPVVGLVVCMLLLEAPFAHAGIERYALRTRDGDHPVRTVSPPVVQNRSLFVNPQRHSYLTRDEDQFPPLAALAAALSSDDA
jgi:acyl carrier protein